MAKKTFYPSLSKRSPRLTDNLVDLANILTGQVGDGLDRAVTYRHLLSGDILSNINFQLSGTVISTPGTGGGGGTPGVETPTQPTNLTASAAFTHIFLEWTAATFGGYAYTEIYRNTIDAFGSAVRVATSIGNIYGDPVAAGVEYFYWIRFVNIDDVIGVINATAGTSATAAIPPAYLLEQLSNQITESELYTDLNTRIDLIDDPATGLVDRLAQELIDRAADVDAEMNARILAVTGVSDNLTILEDEVHHVTTGLPNTNTIANASKTTADGVKARIDAVDGGVKTVEVLSGEFDSLSATIADGVTGLTATGDRVTVVEGRIDNTGAGKNIEAVASDLASLKVTVEHVTTGLAPTKTIADAAVVTADNATARLNDTGSGLTVETVASQFATIKASVEHGTTGLAPTKTIADAANSKANSVESRIDDTGYGQNIETIATQSNSTLATINNGSSGLAAAHSRSLTIENRLTSVDGAGKDLEVLASDVDAIEVVINHGTTGLSATYSISTTVQGRIDDTGSGQGSLEALSSTVSTHSTTIGDHTSSISTISSTQDGIKAEYMVKTDVNGNVSGFGLYNDGVGSDFIISADTFAIAKPGATSIDFAVSDGKVVMDAAHIVNLVVTDAQIQTIRAEKITGGKISSVTVSGASLIGGQLAVGVGPYAYSYTDWVWNAGTESWDSFVDNGSAATLIDSSGNLFTNSIEIKDSGGNVILSSGGSYAAAISNSSQQYADVTGGPPAGATVGADWNSNVNNKPKTFRVVSIGYLSDSHPVLNGLYHEDGAIEFRCGRSFGLSVMNRGTMGWEFHNTYDLWGGGTGQVDALAAKLNSLGPDKIIVLQTYDEPWAYHTSNSLPLAILRCGGSPELFTQELFAEHSAYILVGIPGIGDGNGIELYSDSPDKTDSWCETTFTVHDGNLITGSMTKAPYITAANISTYMKSAAIEEAYIGSAAVTNAKIQDLSVGTLKIKNNAVSIPVSSWANNSVGGSGAGYLAGTAVIEFGADEQYPIYLDFNVLITTSYPAFIVTFKRNGVAIETLVIAGSPLGMVPASFQDTPPMGAATYTYTVEIGGAIFTHRTFLALGSKK